MIVILAVLLGFSIAVNTVVIIAYVQKMEENDRLKMKNGDD